MGTIYTKSLCQSDEKGDGPQTAKSKTKPEIQTTKADKREELNGGLISGSIGLVWPKRPVRHSKVLQVLEEKTAGSHRFAEAAALSAQLILDDRA